MNSNSQDELKDIHDDIIDETLYLQDLFSLKLDRINFILTNSLLYYLVLPLLCGSIISMSKSIISMSLSMYIIAVFFHNIKNESFLNILFSIVFGESIDPKVLSLMDVYPANMKYYEFKMMNHNTLSFVDYISLNFSRAFIKSLVFQSSSPYDEINALIAKFNDSSSSFNLSDEIDKPQINATIMAELFSLLSDKDLDQMSEFHKDIIRSTGISVGFSNMDKGRSIIGTIDEAFHTMAELEVMKLLTSSLDALMVVLWYQIFVEKPYLCT